MTNLKCIFHLYIMTFVTAKKLGIVPVRHSSSLFATFQLKTYPKRLFSPSGRIVKSLIWYKWTCFCASTVLLMNFRYCLKLPLLFSVFMTDSGCFIWSLLDVWGRRPTKTGIGTFLLFRDVFDSSIICSIVWPGRNGDISKTIESAVIRSRCSWPHSRFPHHCLFAKKLTILIKITYKNFFKSICNNTVLENSVEWDLFVSYTNTV